ncbi:hypothetical protein Afil01_11160 [Actinorhabdospora filicis]|uniref:Secreted protein n=1 Tax=Actinorhabdospora filicis TaxID=1785913 RepID=A0A9W6W789_9ACTN|nr:hypothetical protein [Actinorhabdospora filicis]GLZ76309.1 hypothetical protein Afil01_11160 [Actinorhabdospora filicis]
MTHLYLDVDGPLIPFGGPSAYPAFRETGTLLDRVDPAHGPRLLALGCELMWATTWGEDANAHIAPLLGLPRLPVVAWPDEDPPPRVHWKTPGLVACAAGRPFGWLDDEITDADRAWVAAMHPGRALLRRVDARVGLTEEDYAAVRAFTAS